MNDDLQAIARRYLMRLRKTAARHGLLPWVDETITANKENRCAATKDEVRMLSRLCDDADVRRADIPEILGKSYRQCVEDEDFDSLKTTRRHGIYDKVSVLLLAMKLKKKRK